MHPATESIFHGVQHTADNLCNVDLESTQGLQILKKWCGVHSSAETISAVCCTRGDNFVIEYLGEIETDFENTLACLSGAQMGLNHEKN